MEIADYVAWTAVQQYGALQKPAELAWLIRKVEAIKPRIIIEIGSDAGGTLFVWRGLAPTVLGIDLPRGPFSTGRPLSTHGATMILGNSHDFAVVGAAQGFLAARQADVLFLDGDHSEAGVDLDFRMYAPLVRDGGMIVLQDIRDHHRDDVGVHLVWERIKREYDTEECIADDDADWAGIGIATWKGMQDGEASQVPIQAEAREA